MATEVKELEQLRREREELETQRRQEAEQRQQAETQLARERALRQYPRISEEVLNRFKGSPEEIADFAKTLAESLPSEAPAVPPSAAGEPQGSPVPAPGPGAAGPPVSQADEVQSEIDQLMGTRSGREPFVAGDPNKFGGPYSRYDVGRNGENIRALFEKTMRNGLNQHVHRTRNS